MYFKICLKQLIKNNDEEECVIYMNYKRGHYKSDKKTIHRFSSSKYLEILNELRNELKNCTGACMFVKLDNINHTFHWNPNRIKYIKVYQFCMVIMLLSAGYELC